MVGQSGVWTSPADSGAVGVSRGDNRPPDSNTNSLGEEPIVAYAFVLIVGIAAGALSGIIGTGSSIMLLPYWCSSSVPSKPCQSWQ
jgi:uncharacterized membrane protein YfcA